MKKVGIIGGGICGTTCAYILKSLPSVSVILYDRGRKLGGRFSTKIIDEYVWDYGASFFECNDSEFSALLKRWESDGMVQTWNCGRGILDASTRRFTRSLNADHIWISPTHNHSLLQKLSSDVDVRLSPVSEVNYNATTKKYEIQNEEFDYIIVANHVSLCPERYERRYGYPTPFKSLAPNICKVAETISCSPVFVTMASYEEPLNLPYEITDFQNSNCIRKSIVESNKPGRQSTQEQLMIHSQFDYARQYLKKGAPSMELNEAIGKEIIDSFTHHVESAREQPISAPSFIKTHRWGSAFPIVNQDLTPKKCLQDGKILAGGDWCVSPDVQGSILSAISMTNALQEQVC